MNYSIDDIFVCFTKKDGQIIFFDHNFMKIIKINNKEEILKKIQKSYIRINLKETCSRDQLSKKDNLEMIISHSQERGKSKLLHTKIFNIVECNNAYVSDLNNIYEYGDTLRLNGKKYNIELSNLHKDDVKNTLNNLPEFFFRSIFIFINIKNIENESIQIKKNIYEKDNYSVKYSFKNLNYQLHKIRCSEKEANYIKSYKSRQNKKKLIEACL